MEKHVNTVAETSGWVDVITAVIPFVLLMIIGAIIVTIVYIVKVVRRYLANGKIAEQKLRTEETDIKEIKQRLDRIEKILSKFE